jgi:hypothetical protein
VPVAATSPCRITLTINASAQTAPNYGANLLSDFCLRPVIPPPGGGQWDDGLVTILGLLTQNHFARSTVILDGLLLPHQRGVRLFAVRSATNRSKQRLGEVYSFHMPRDSDLIELLLQCKEQEHNWQTETQ